jgi:hypothetical protein
MSLLVARCRANAKEHGGLGSMHSRKATSGSQKSTTGRGR